VLAYRLRRAQWSVKSTVRRRRTASPRLGAYGLTILLHALI